MLASAPDANRYDDRRFRTFIIGAGFSAAAGLPLAGELWREVLSRAGRLPGIHNFIQDDLERFHEFKAATAQGVPADLETDFEEFLGYLDIEHFLWLRGSDTFSHAGNKSQLLIRWLIGQILVERQQEGRASRLDAYLQFAEHIRGGDYIITFNYDTLIEEALECVGRPYRLFPNRFESVEPLSNTIDARRDEFEAVVIKLHGSVDWFDRTGHEQHVEILSQVAEFADTERVAQVYNMPPRHPVFGRDRIVEPTPLLEGPRPALDPLRQIWRVANPELLYNTSNAGYALLGSSPFLLAPSRQKLIYSQLLVEYWNGMSQGGGLSLGMGIIGYSLPRHDEYVLQALYGFTRNYTEYAYDEEILGKKKLPLRFVDLQPTDERRRSFMSTYQFVNWERAEAFYEGFGDAAVEFLFRESRA